MNKQFYVWTFVLVSLTSAFSSCRKGDIGTGNIQNLEGTWAITGIRSDRPYDWNGDGRTETDIYGSYTNCQRDIVLVLSGNGYGQIRQGCDAQWQNIRWQLYNGNRTLVLTLPNDDLNLSLSQLDNYTIRGTDPVSVDGANFNVTYTLQRR